MSVEIAWKQNNLVTDFHLLKLLQVVFGLGLQAFVCDFSRQNICSVANRTSSTCLGMLQTMKCYSARCIAVRDLKFQSQIVSRAQPSVR